MLFDGSPELADEMKLVECRIQSALSSHLEMIREAAKDLLTGGGKRVRPALTLISSYFGTGDRNGIVDLAAAVEIIHMATLVHDDIVDESSLRRGRPTTQARFGKDVAVFVGDYLLTQALMLLAGCRTSITNPMLSMAKGMGRVCEGEIAQFADRYRLRLDVHSYLKKIRAKTALLLALSCAVGAEHSGADRRTVKALGRYGMNLGMAFQIHDDMMDFTLPAEQTGKPRIHDLQNGVFTLPVIYAATDPRCGYEVRQMAASPDGSPEWAARLAELVLQTDAIERCASLASKYTRKACDYLKQIPINRYQKLLVELPDLLFGRPMSADDGLRLPVTSAG